MSSRTFKARTSHTKSDPQICGLHSACGCASTINDEEVGGAILRDHECFYLTCRGDAAQPGMQIHHSKKSDGYPTGYRVVKSGRYRTYKDRFGGIHRKAILKWQEQAGNGRWHDVTVWERMVRAGCAETLGYQLPGASTRAHVGNRTEGYAHRVKAAPISGLEELAIATDEVDSQEEAPPATDAA